MSAGWSCPSALITIGPRWTLVLAAGPRTGGPGLHDRRADPASPHLAPAAGSQRSPGCSRRSWTSARSASRCGTGAVRRASAAGPCVRLGLAGRDARRRAGDRLAGGGADRARGRRRGCSRGCSSSCSTTTTPCTGRWAGPRRRGGWCGSASGGRAGRILVLGAAVLGGGGAGGLLCVGGVLLGRSCSWSSRPCSGSARCSARMCPRA